MNMSIRPTFKVGIIIGSQRVVRAGPQITDFVLDTIKTHHATADGPDIAFDVIDIAALNLPLFDEPGVPQKITSPEGYAHEHTRQWSRRVAALDAFVFVSPQYNWGIPAGLKNAIDYLFNEWKGKPAMVVTYGGHGGDKCAAQLKTVLGGGIDMRVAETAVNLSFPGREFLVKAATGKPLGLSASDDASPWADQRGKIVGVWEDMVKMLA
ncbi:flavoprotein-like protein [Diplogelasinospora grovesii]|uniref:Flavoprotein-like protein n=1 Tax=Diplogelasinospora grovesii TaxID=303347 RepID=A0AAN6MZJ7_9PEZI|nr:flavoprotein-like protein [Diplogelasinospora grovesii]